MPDPQLEPRRTNWGGNVIYRAKRIHYPTTADEVARLVAAAEKVRPLGTRHSFNRIADTDGELICVAKMNAVGEIDRERQTVTVEPGITYGALGAALHRQGRAIDNLPSLPHVCVGGAVQTGTHGSGTQNLSAAVVAMQIATADGRLVELSREKDGDTFNGCVVAMGLLGVVTRLTLRTHPAFAIRQEVYEHVAVADVVKHYDAMIQSAYSLSLFTDWQSEAINQVWFKRDATAGPPAAPPFAFLKGKRAPVNRHPIAAVPADACTDQQTPGPAFERLPHFRPDHEPSSAGQELQSEYFFARKDFPAVVETVLKIGPHLRDVLMISEVRTIKPDNLWLSPAYERDAFGIHFTWRPMQAAVVELLRTVVEPALKPFDPRPHWGKLFGMKGEEVRAKYAKVSEFLDLRRRFDPAGKFVNDFAGSILAGNLV